MALVFHPFTFTGVCTGELCAATFATADLGTARQRSEYETALATLG